MVEELNSEITNNENIIKGDRIKGKVVKIGEKEALVDVGYKYDGVIPIGEISNIHIEEVSDALKEGDEVLLKVIKINDDEEKLILSKRAVDSEDAWDNLKAKYESGEIFEVVVADIVKGGLVVDVGVRGFIPASLVETHFVEDFTDYKGKKLRVKVIELDKEKNKVILSQRVVLEAEDEKKKEELIANIKEGTILEGTVQRLTDFGAFIDIGGVDGLVHVSELDWERVNKPSDVLNEGDKVKAKVLRVDPVNQKISLSIKETKPSPWESIYKELQIGEIYPGKIKRLVSFGAFVELFPNVEGLVHISQIANEHITKPSDVLEVGQEVKVKVLDVDLEKKKISLSIREAAEKEFEEEKLKYTENHSGLNLTLGDVFGDKLNKLK